MMPETPDFDQIAARMAQGTVINTSGGSDVLPRAIQKFAEQLRQVWNARGATDRAALGVEFRRAMDEGGGEIRPEEILKALDR